MIKIIISYLLGSILTFIIMSYYFGRKIKLNSKLSEAMNKATKSIAENLTNNNLMFNKLHDNVNKKSMEKQLRIKLDMENELKELDKKTLKKIKDLS